VEALIITGGEVPDAAFLLKLSDSADIVIAADSGLDAARGAGIVPDIIVGDFDSIRDRESLLVYEKEHIFKYSVEKDATDTEIALAKALERGASRIVLAGGGGGRLDHLIGLVNLFRRKSSPDVWHTAAESVYRLRAGENSAFAANEGTLVSVFPILESSSGMYSKGLRWPLEGLVWHPGEFGLSNIATGPGIEIHAGSTDLLVILPLGTKRLA